MTEPVSGALNDGLIWYVWIDYDGPTQTLEVRLWPIAVRPAAPTLTVELDLLSVLGSSNVFAGFTAGTGGAWNDHDIRTWHMSAR